MAAPKPKNPARLGFEPENFQAEPEKQGWVSYKSILNLHYSAASNHRMHEIHVLLLPMFLAASLSVTGFTRLRSTQMAERIEIVFGVKTHGGPGNIVLNGDLDPPRRGECEAHSMQSLPNYYDLLF